MRSIYNRLEAGSALLATLVITGAVGLILVSVAGFTARELRITTALEDSSIAYAAAEAGIEEGLLRWRYARNTELPQAEMQESVERAERVNLTTGDIQTNVPLGEVLIQDATHSVYDLRMWYKTPQVGLATDLESSTHEKKLFKDQTLEMDVSNLRGETLLFRFATVPGTNRSARIETRVIAEDAEGNVTELCANAGCKQLTPDPVTRSQVTITVPQGPDTLAYRLRVKPFIFITGNPLIDAGAESYITYAIELPGASVNRTTRLLDDGITYIEATGYYGSAKRKLLAKVDRRSGTVLGVYDFALYAGDPNANILPGLVP